MKSYSQLGDEEEEASVHVWSCVQTSERVCQRNWIKSKDTARDLKLVMMELTPQQEGLKVSANQKRLKVSNADNTSLDEER